MVNLQSALNDPASASIDVDQERRVVPVLTDLFDTGENENQLALIDVKQSKYHQMIARRNAKNQGALGYGLENEDFD